MPYDKLVDSARLDGALTATADAIRAKTGGSAKIAWDATEGFKSVISGIQAGGYKVATGSYTVGDSEARFNNGITITGLGFKPSLVFFYDGAAPEAYVASMKFLRCVEIGATNTYVYDDIYTDGDTEEEYGTKVRANLSTSTVYGTLNDDGFTIKSATSCYIYLEADHTFYYVAIA